MLVKLVIAILGLSQTALALLSTVGQDFSGNRASHGLQERPEKVSISFLPQIIGQLKCS
jgi:hypothetical protein